MDLRIASVPKEQLDACIKNGLWGANIENHISRWVEGDLLAFKVNKEFVALAKICGKLFIDNKKIWSKSGFNYRVPIEFLKVFNYGEGIDFGLIRPLLEVEWGKKYGWGILNKKALSPETANKIISMFQEIH